MNMRDPYSRRRMKLINRDMARFVAGLCIVFLAIVVIGCAALAMTDKLGVNLRSVFSDTAVAGGRLDRVYDADAGVVCWIGRLEDGISCLPVSQTNLEGGDIK